MRTLKIVFNRIEIQVLFATRGLFSAKTRINMTTSSPREIQIKQIASSAFRAENSKPFQLAIACQLSQIIEFGVSIIFSLITYLTSDSTRLYNSPTRKTSQDFRRDNAVTLHTRWTAHKCASCRAHRHSIFRSFHILSTRVSMNGDVRY